MSGQPPDALTGAVNVPLYLSSTYAQKEIGGEPEYDYSRAGNPTRTAVEECLASLEGGTTAHVFGSGMAAIAALVTMLKSGDHVICGENVYGGTPRLFNQVFAHYGIEFTYVDTSDLEALKAAIRPETKLVHIETPTNPLMTLTDIAAVAEDLSQPQCRDVGRQHLHVALLSAADRVGRGHRDAFDDQVSEWPQRWDWRGTGRHQAGASRRNSTSSRRRLARFFRRLRAG